MHAAVLTEVPSDQLLIADDVSLRSVGPGEVQIRMAHSGVCHSDLSLMEGTIPTEAPKVLGHEGSGVVTDVGDGVSSVEVGDHVVIAFSPPCGACAYCNERAQANLCITGLFTMQAHTQFEWRGEPLASMSGCGAFAEKTIVPEMAAIRIDPSIPLDVAALVSCGVTTGVGAAVNGAGVTPGSSVVVIGCGGVGIAAVQGARIAGASTILAVDLHEGKLERALGFGATHTATPEQLDDAKQELTGGEGFDYAIEAIGRATTMRQAYDLIRRGGTACIVGVGPVTESFEIVAFEPWIDEKTLVGSMYGSSDVRTDFARYLGYYTSGELDLEGMISRRIGLADVNEALHALGEPDVVRQVIDY